MLQPFARARRAIAQKWQRVDGIHNAHASAGAIAVPRRRLIDCMELEDRTLFNAAPLAAVASGAASPASTTSAAQQAGALGADSHTTNVVLIDKNLTDSSLLASAVLPDTKVWLYDGAHESAGQVLTDLEHWAKSTDTQIQSLSILSHGAAGEFELGNQWISTTTLSQTAVGWEQLRGLLAPDAAIELYGCDVAEAGSAGQALIDQLADLSGAAVFASTNLTGEGGDWNLEAESDKFGSPSATAEVGPFDYTILAEYDATLAAFTVTNTNDSGAGSLRQAIIDADAGSGLQHDRVRFVDE